MEGVKVATPGWLLVSVSGGSWVLEICLAFLHEIHVFLAILNVFPMGFQWRKLPTLQARKF